MAAYMIAMVEVRDPAGMEAYVTGVGPVLAQYGGRFLGAAPPEVMEGEPRPHVSALIEFPSMEQARAWYDCSEYQQLKALRQRSAQTTLFFLDGLPAHEPFRDDRSR